jgi:hypothetical protein
MDQAEPTTNTTLSTPHSSVMSQGQNDLDIAMDQARAITDALEGFIHRRQRSSLPQPRPWQGNSDALIPIIHWRNAIHHKLLCLPRAVGLLSRDSAVYEACRLATLIYSNLVIFPLPTGTGVQSRLATQMCKTLRSCDVYSCWAEEPFKMLWLTMMGGIAATDGMDRLWYARKLTQIWSENLRAMIPTWQACTEALETYLWWRHVCDEPGRLLWAIMSGEADSQL